MLVPNCTVIHPVAVWKNMNLIVALEEKSEDHLRKQISFAKFFPTFRGATEIIQPENITSWHGLCTAKDRRALQQLINTTQSLTGSHLVSVSDISEVPVQSPEDTETQYPHQQQPAVTRWKSLTKSFRFIIPHLIINSVSLVSPHTPHHHTLCSHQATLHTDAYAIKRIVLNL